MAGLGSKAEIFTLVLNATGGAVKTIGKNASDDLTIPSMVKRVRIRGQAETDAWHYAYEAGEANAGKFMPAFGGEGYDWTEISEFPKLYVISGDAGTPTLAVEVWE